MKHSNLILVAIVLFALLGWGIYLHQWYEATDQTYVKNLETQNLESLEYASRYATRDDFFNREIPDAFSSEQIYLHLTDWLKVYQRDSDFFLNHPEGDEEYLFYQIWSNYLFDTNYSIWECQKLFSCLDWSISYTQINDSFCSQVCLWIDEFNTKYDANFYKERHQFIQYKNALQGRDIQYEFNDDYFISRILKWQYTEETLLKDLFFFLSAKRAESCHFLEDDLKQLCEDDLEFMY